MTFELCIYSSTKQQIYFLQVLKLWLCNKAGHRRNVCRLEIKTRATALPQPLNIDPESALGLFGMQRLSGYSSFSFFFGRFLYQWTWKVSKSAGARPRSRLPVVFSLLHFISIFFPLASSHVISPHNSVRSNPHTNLFSILPRTSALYNRPLTDTGTQLKFLSNSCLPNISDLPWRRQ